MIYLIRHGQTAKNKAKVLQGRSNIPLDEEGVRQAEAARFRLEGMGVHFQKVYSSPLLRAVQTAQILTGDQMIQREDRLIEMDYGPYEGMDLTAPAPEVLAFFLDFVHVPAPQGMEPLSQVVHRLGSFLEEIREEAERDDVLLSTHAIAMKGALEYLTPDSHGSYWSRYLGNCEIYRAEVRPDGSYGIPYQI